MGQIANRTLAELIFRLKNKLKAEKEEKNPRKIQTSKGDRMKEKSRNVFKRSGIFSIITS